MLLFSKRQKEETTFDSEDSDFVEPEKDKTNKFEFALTPLGAGAQGGARVPGSGGMTYGPARP